MKWEPQNAHTDVTDSDLYYTDQRLHFTEQSYGIKNNEHFSIPNMTEDKLKMLIKVHFTWIWSIL